MSAAGLELFLSSMTRAAAPQRPLLPFVGIDECLNRAEVHRLCRDLLQARLIDSSEPLWYELRERDGAIVASFLGGVDQHSMLRKPNSPLPDIGVPVKHHSWTDLRVIQLLLAHFTTYDRVVLLSENTRCDQDGLRSLLRRHVGPALTSHPHGLSLTALFRRGNTRIDTYATAVTAFFTRGSYPPGYVEALL